MMAARCAALGATAKVEPEAATSAIFVLIATQAFLVALEQTPAVSAQLVASVRQIRAPAYYVLRGPLTLCLKLLHALNALPTPTPIHLGLSSARIVQREKVFPVVPPRTAQGRARQRFARTAQKANAALGVVTTLATALRLHWVTIPKTPGSASATCALI